MSRPYPQLSPWALAKGEATAGAGGGVSGAANFKGALLRKTGTQSFASGAGADVEFDTAIFDDGGHFNASSPTLIYFPDDSVTHAIINGGVNFEGNPSPTSEPRFLLQIDKNDVTTLARQDDTSVGSGATGFSASLTTGLIPVNSGDFFELQALQIGGTNMNVTSRDFTFFGVTYVEAIPTTLAQSFKGALVCRDTNVQSIASGVLTPLEVETEMFDDAGIWDSSSPSILKVTGDWKRVIVFGSQIWDVAGVGGGIDRRSISIRKNGTNRTSGNGWQAIVNRNIEQSVTAWFDVVSGDFFEVMCFQDNGNSVNILANDLTNIGLAYIENVAVTFRGVQAYITSVKSIASSTVTVVSFDATNYDTDGFWTANSPDLVRIPFDCRARVTVQGAFESSPGGVRRFIRSTLNGSQQLGMPAHDTAASDFFMTSLTGAVRDFSSGDLIRMTAFQDSGGNALLDEDVNPAALSIEIVELL